MEGNSFLREEVVQVALERRKPRGQQKVLGAHKLFLLIQEVE